ncbi:MAG: YerC/YecD family TrpR-related protein [Oscillospiraceae bacterium]|nr:YerC/YecD family TrpR-related protein [Oscillospiraceae bacterium]
MNQNVSTEDNNRRLFFRALTVLESKDEAAAFFDELCTRQEIRAISQRVAVAELLVQGNTYEEIKQTLRHGDSTISTATINRINNTIKNGRGDLRRIIQRASGIEGC